MINQRAQRNMVISMGAIIVLTLSALGFQKMILAKEVTGQTIIDDIPTLTMGSDMQILTVGNSTASPVVISTSKPQDPRVFFVSTQGSDSAPGTLDQPWKTIRQAITKAEPGTQIFVRGGDYFESVIIHKSGKAGLPIRLTAYEQEKVIIDGGENPAIEANGSYWIMDGLELASNSDRVIKLNSNNWRIHSNLIRGSVYIWGDHNILENNEIDGSRHLGNENGIMEDGEHSFNNFYQENWIHDFTSRGIWSQWYTRGSKIINNHVEHITGPAGICIDLDGATSVVNDHIIRGNTVHDCQQSGIELENAYNTLVENNLVYQTGLEGIQVISYDTCQPQVNVVMDCRGTDLKTTIQQNIIYDAGRVGGIVSYEASGVKVLNNTVYGGESVALYINSPSQFANHWIVMGNIFSQHQRAEISVADPGSLLVDEGNILDPSTQNRIYEVRTAENRYYSLEQWQIVNNLGLNSLTGVVGFIAPQEGNFHLSEDSLALSACPNTGIELDAEGKPRPQNANFDCGAYEQSGEE